MADPFFCCWWLLIVCQRFVEGVRGMEPRRERKEGFKSVGIVEKNGWKSFKKVGGTKIFKKA